MKQRHKIMVTVVTIILIILKVYIYHYYIHPLVWSVYEKNVYSVPVFEKIKAICNNVPPSQMQLDMKANGRLMYTFPTQDPIYYLVYNPNFIQKVRQLTKNPKLVPCLEVPIEYRKYLVGSSMDWHRDTKMLPDQDQYECVITLTNTSDSETLLDKLLWIKRISSEPNSAVIVKARGISHKVTRSTHGERTILKVVLKEG